MTQEQAQEVREKVSEMRDAFRHMRMKMWYVVAFLSSAILFYVYPQQAGTLLWKLNVISLALLIGFFADRSLFPDDRPGRGDWGWVRDAAYQFRRTLLVGAVVLAVSNVA